MTHPRRRAGNDAGATLLIVLVIITTIALVGGVTLSYASTSMMTTVALRDEAGTAYNGDGAAQLAINDLRQGAFNGSPSGQCSTTPAALTLDNFYPATKGQDGSAPSSAYVSCTPEENNGQDASATAANTSPTSALLTLDANLTEDGISAGVSAGALKVRGGVFSNSRITAPTGLTNVWSPPASNPTGKTYNVARGSCDTTMVTVANPAYGTTTCDYGSAPDARGQDPGTLTPHGASYDAPPTPSGPGSIGTCAAGTEFQTVTPGRFTDAAALSNLTGCSKNVVWFKPGIYYFDFTPADTQWKLPSTFMIAGTNAIPLTSTPTAAQMPTACVPPGDAAATTTSGAEFVFGGDSTLLVNSAGGSGSHLAICASNSANGPPIAIYGLKTALGGGYPVAAQTVCPPTDRSCALINTKRSSTSTLTIQGTTYAPRAFIDIALDKDSKTAFRWGLIAYAVRFTGTGSADVSQAVVGVPDVAASPAPTPTIMYLQVYVCPGASTCSPAGKLQLVVKVGLSATAPKSATVLSWSEQR